MTDRSKVIFGNEISARAYRKAVAGKQKYIKKFGDDSKADYPVKLTANATLGEMLGVRDIRVAEGEGETDFDLEKGVIHRRQHPHGLRSLPHLYCDGVGSTRAGLQALLDGSQLL